MAAPIQTKTYLGDTAASSVACAFDTAPAVGSIIIAMVMARSGTAVIACDAEGGQTAILTTVPVGGSNTCNAAVFSWTYAADNSFTISFSGSGAVTYDIWLAEYSENDVGSIEASAKYEDKKDTITTTMASGSATALTANGTALFGFFLPSSEKWDATESSVSLGTIIYERSIGVANRGEVKVASHDFTTAQAYSSTLSTTDIGSKGSGVVLILSPGSPVGPTIINQPDNETVEEGGTARFESGATISDGGGSLRKQWYEVGTPNVLLTGKTGNVLTFTASLSDDGKAYFNRYTDDNGSTNTNSATLTVNPVSQSITIVDAAPQADHYYPRSKGATGLTQENITRSITYTGDPSSLEYRLVRASDSTTEVRTWTTFDAAPSGGTSTLSFTAPSTIYPVYIQVRTSGGATDIETVQWRVGIIVLVAGDMNARYISIEGDTPGDDPITAPVGYMAINGGLAQAAPTVGTCGATLAQAIEDMYNCGLLIINAGVLDSAMTAEAAGSSNYWANPASTLFTTAATGVSTGRATAANIHMMIWIHGTKDANEGVTKENYLRVGRPGGLNSFFANCRDTWTDVDGGVLPITTTTMDNNWAAGNAGQEIREAYLDMCRFDPLSYECNSVDTQNLAHYGAPWRIVGKVAMGERFAAFYQLHNGDSTANFPKVIGVSSNDAKTVLTLHYDSNIDALPTNYYDNDIKITDNGVDKVISSWTRTGDRTTAITMSTAYTGSLYLWVMYGAVDTTVERQFPGKTVNLINGAGTALLTMGCISAALEPL